MAVTLLTKSYQEVSRVSLTYGELVTYAKYSTQSKENNTTTYQLKTIMHMDYYYSWSFDSANAYLDDDHKVYGYTTFYRGDTTIQEITRTKEHNADGSCPAFDFYSGFYANYGGGGQSRPEITFPKIDRYPQILTVTNFNDEQNPTITYTTTLGFSGATVYAGISLDRSQADVPYRQIDVTAGQYTFNLTEQERNTLRNATTTSTSRKVYFYIKTTANGTNYYSSKEATFSVINANPTFTYTAEEQNSNVISMLGTNDGTTVVGNASELEFTYTPTTLKGATVKNFVVSEGIAGNTYQSYTLTTSPYVQTFDITDTTYSGKFVFQLTDSRNLSTTVTDTSRTLLDYDVVKINSYNFKRQSQTSSNIILNAEFNYWGNIGSYTNTPVVKYRLDSGSWVTIPSVNYTIDSTNHKLTITNYTISNILPYTSPGQFSISIEDILTSKVDTSDNGKVLKGIPTFDYGEHDLKVNGDLYVADTTGSNAKNVMQEIEKAKIYANTYSTTEQMVGTWTNNKPIYRKVFTGSSIETINTGTSTVDEVIKMEMLVKEKTSNVWRNVPWLYNSTDTTWMGGFMYRQNEAQFRFQLGSALANITKYIIIFEYTKTTD